MGKIVSAKSSFRKGHLEQSITGVVVRLTLELAIILIAAKIAGELLERYLRQPAVLGELGVGILIGPYALGSVPLPWFGPLFPLFGSGGRDVLPISQVLYTIAQLAIMVLLFKVGLDTDFRQFFRYGPSAAIVAIGGVIFPFLFGVYATVLFGYAQAPSDPAALFMGVIMTATSVGITARILADLNKLNQPEGITVLGAAVFDDVLGILILTIVISVVDQGRVSVGEVAGLAGKALGFWVALTGIGILVSRPLSRFILSFRVSGAGVALALGLAFLAAVVAESAGLAMIIGAYSMGLALANTDVSPAIRRDFSAIYEFLVPVFFVVTGMLVNYRLIGDALLFGAVISLLAIISKVLGCGLPSLLVGFNLRGATRIGLGMLPRGEVALLVAGIGLARGVVGNSLFGVAVFMTIVTTVIAPIFLVPAFQSGGSGLRREEKDPRENHNP